MSSDQNLLFGFLAFQNSFIDRQELLTAVDSWLSDKKQPLDQILLNQDAVTESQHKLLVNLVELHLEQHRGDAEKSLAALSSLDGSLQLSLRQLGDNEVEATLGHLGSGRAGNDTTHSFSVGRATSEGARFRVLRPHAKGGLGEVFVAKDLELHREVALKEIQGSHADDENSRSRFVLEAEVTGGLEHPGIVPVYGLGQYDDGRPYYAMRFVRGDSLKEAADRYHERADSLSDSERTLELRQLMGRFIDVCQAISYAHSRGVLHRDLKPGNIMLGKYGETLVVDWGLAKVVGRRDDESSDETTLRPSSGSGSAPTVLGSAIGTPAYMSPEQAAGRLDQLGTASDVYSLGATLYYVLVGNAPFGGDDVGQVLNRVQDGEFLPPRVVNPSTPPALNAICVKAMSSKPDDRYDSPQVLAEDVERFLADEPVIAFQEPVVLRARRWLRKHQTIAAVTVAVVLVLAIGLGVFSSVVGGMNLELRHANSLLVASNEKLDQKNVELTEARNMAESRFGIALEAIEKYYTGASEDVLLREPRFNELRVGLLTDALTFYKELQQLIELAEPSHQTKALADAYLAIGEISNDIGRLGEAINALEESSKLYEKGVNSASDTEFVVGQERALSRLARILESQGEFAAAIDAYNVAAKLCLELAHDDTFKYGDAMQRYASIASVEAKQGHPDNSLQWLQKAERIVRTLEQRKAGNDDHKAMAVVYDRLAIICLQRMDIAASQAAYQKAIFHAKRVVELDPHDDAWIFQLCVIELNSIAALREIDVKKASTRLESTAERLNDLGSRTTDPEQSKTLRANALMTLAALRWEGGNEEEAIALTRKSMELYEELVTAKPNLSYLRNELAKAYTNLGARLIHNDKPDLAITYCQRAVDVRSRLLADNPDVTEYVRGYSLALLNLAALQSRGEGREKAEASLDEAIRILELASAREPGNYKILELLAGAYRNRLIFAARSGANTNVQIDLLTKQIRALEGVRSTKGPTRATLSPLYKAYLARSQIRESDSAAANLVPEHSTLVRSDRREVVRIGEALYELSPELRPLLVNALNVLIADQVLDFDNVKWQELTATLDRRMELDDGSQETLSELFAAAVKLLRSLGARSHAQGLEKKSIAPRKAVSELTTAIAIYQRLTDYAPEEESYVLLSSAYDVLGQAWCQLRDYHEASNAYKKSLAALDSETVSPETASREKSKRYTNLGITCNRLNQLEASIDAFDRALVEISHMTRNGHLGKSDKTLAFSTCTNRADVLSQLRRYDESLADWKRAEQFGEVRQSPELVLLRARVLAITGDHESAFGDISETIMSAERSDHEFYRLALRALSSGAQAASSEVDVDARVQADLITKYTAMSVQVLDEAIASTTGSKEDWVQWLRGEDELQFVANSTALKEWVERMMDTSK